MWSKPDDGAVDGSVAVADVATNRQKTKRPHSTQSMEAESAIAVVLGDALLVVVVDVAFHRRSKPRRDDAELKAEVELDVVG